MKRKLVLLFCLAVFTQQFVFSQNAYKAGKKDGVWIATSGAQALHQACAAVAAKLDDLGIGDQLVSGMCSDLFTYLQNAMQQQSTSQVSELVVQAADHAASAYEQALANKVATQSLSESQVRFAHQVAQGAGTYVSLDSVVLRDKAMAVSRDRGVSFGEALRIVRHSFASDVVEPDVLKSAVVSAIHEKLSSMLQGKKKVINPFDVEQLAKAATDAVQKLNVSGHSEVSDAIVGSLKFLSRGSNGTAVDPAGVDSIATKAATSAAAAYSKHLSSVS